MRTVYRADRIHTLSHPATGEWLLIDGRHVARVGSGDPPRADRTVHLPGTTIIPGFIDAHVHLTSTGMALDSEAVTRARSAADLLALVRSRAAAEPLVLQGYDESLWDDPRVPTLAELDDVAPGPLIIRRADGHVALANSAAIRASEIGEVPGCERGLDGGYTGRITQEADQRLWAWVTASLSDHQVQDHQLRAASLAASRGVTTVHEMAMPHWYGTRDLDVFLGHRERLPVDTALIVATTDIGQAVDLGLPAVGGDLPADGSIGARTAALSAPYEDVADDGHLYLEDEALASFFRSGNLAGIQVGVHAIGDRAIEQVIRTWEGVYRALDSRERRHFRARRHRIEHFEMPSAAQIERAAMLGLAISAQPTFDAAWGGPGGLYEIGVGPGRAASMNPFRTYLDRGLEFGVGSDAPITPLDPMLSLAALASHHDPAQRLTRAEAMDAHTTGSARLAHQEEKKGGLGPGMHADFAAYPHDPFIAGDIEALRPVLTVSLGREVFLA
ncbi:MAG: amidohydrolase family protein [Actinomycetota bacterium]